MAALALALLALAAAPAPAGQAAPERPAAGDERALPPTDSGQVSPGETSMPMAGPEESFGGEIVSMLGALALVLAVVVGLYWLSRRFFPTMAGGQGDLRLLGRLQLGQRAFVALVEVAGKVLVLGVGPDGMRLLDKVEDPQVVAGLRPAGPRASSFLQSLKKASGSEDKP